MKLTAKNLAEGRREPRDEKEQALRDLLKILADHPELADRITITIKLSKITQGDAEPTDNTE